MSSPPFSADQLSWLATHGADLLGADLCGGGDLTEPSAEANEQRPPSSGPEATEPPTLGSSGEPGEVVVVLVTKLEMRGMLAG